MSLRRLGSETLIYGISSVLGRLLNFVLVTPYITYLMTEREVGEVGNLMFWTALLIALLLFRMDTAVFRFASRPEFDAASVIMRARRVVGALVAAVILPLLLLPDLAGWLLGASGDYAYILLVLVTVALDALSMVMQAQLRLAGRAAFFAAVNVGNVVVNILLIYGLLYVLPRVAPQYYIEEFRVGYYLLAIAVAALLRFVVLSVDMRLRFGRETRVQAERKAILDAGTNNRAGAPDSAVPYRDLLRYSWPLTVVSVAGILNALAGPAILIRYDEAAAGYFAAALRMAVFLNLFVTAYQYAAEPYFFRQAGGDLATADRGIYGDALRAYGIVGTLAAAGILLALPWLQYFIGPDVRPGLAVLPILLLANLLFGVYSNLSIAYKLTDRTFLGGGIALVGSLFAVGLPLLFVAEYGMYAPAVGMLLCFAVMTGLVVLVSRRYFPVDYPFGRLLLYLLLAGGAWQLGELGEAMWWRGGVFVGLCVIFYILERRWLRQIIRS